MILQRLLVQDHAGIAALLCSYHSSTIAWPMPFDSSRSAAACVAVFVYSCTKESRACHT